MLSDVDLLLQFPFGGSGLVDPGLKHKNYLVSVLENFKSMATAIKFYPS